VKANTVAEDIGAKDSLGTVLDCEAGVNKT
jgi:hypothetical protein